MTSLIIGFFECGHDQFHIGFSGQIPRDDFPGEEILNNTEIVPFTGDFYVSEVTNPDKIWRLLIKLLLKIVGTIAIIVMFAVMKWSICGHPG